jgi:tetratricopeptide (TPR) repeat protein
MPREKLKEKSKEAQKFLTKPAENARKIVAILIRPRWKARSVLLERFERELKDTESAAERGALQYLIAETHYWGFLRGARQQRDVSIIEAAPRVVIPAFLEALETVRKAEGESAQPLERDIARRLFRLATTKHFGQSLDPELKAEMVTRFIEPLEDTGDAPSEWNPELMAKVYNNLGIADRLAHLVPEKVPEASGELHDAMNLAWKLGYRKRALQFAKSLEKRMEQKKGKSAYDTFRVFRQMKSPRSLPLIKAIARHDPKAYLQVYALSRSEEKDMSEAERFGYVESYLEEMSRKDPREAAAFLKAARHLSGLGEYVNALKVIDRGLRIQEVRNNENTVHLLYVRGRCYEELYRRESATAAYREAVQLAEDINAKLVRNMCKRALSRATSDPESR